MDPSYDVQAVCFDLDSTLCVSDQSDREIHRATFDRVGVEPFFTVADVRAVDATDLPTAESSREFYENLYRAVARDVGADPDPGVLSALAEATDEVVDPTAVSFRPGAREALEWARERFAVGLITNGGEETQAAKLDQLGIRDAFDTAVFCDPAEGMQPKPDPAPFECALADLGTPADGTLYVGDQHSSDVAGAHNAGWHSAWVPLDRPHATLPADPQPAPTYRLRSPSDLSTVL